MSPIPDNFELLIPGIKGKVMESLVLYLKSIDDHMPAIFLPKEMGDLIGPMKVAEIAKNYAEQIGADVSIAYDPVTDMLKVAPPEYMVGHGQLHYIDTVIKESTWTVPLRKWERMVPEYLGGKPVPVPTRALSYEEFDEARKQPQKISKPPNSWILFRRDKRSLVKERYPDATIGQISTIAAEMWAKTDACEKWHWHVQAENLKMEHLKQNPGWKCSPRKSNEIRKRSTTAKSSAKKGPVLISMDNSSHFTIEMNL